MAARGSVGRRVSIFNNASASSSVYGNLTNVLVNNTIDGNLYSCADGAGCADDFPGRRSLAQWQAWGRKDAHSVIGHPGYMPGDPVLTLGLRRDFRVAASRSPAVGDIGFKPLSLHEIGPRPTIQRLAPCSNDGGNNGTWWLGCHIGSFTS